MTMKVYNTDTLEGRQEAIKDLMGYIKDIGLLGVNFAPDHEDFGAIMFHNVMGMVHRITMKALDSEPSRDRSTWSERTKLIVNCDEEILRILIELGGKND